MVVGDIIGELVGGFLQAILPQPSGRALAKWLWFLAAACAVTAVVTWRLGLVWRYSVGAAAASLLLALLALLVHWSARRQERMAVP